MNKQATTVAASPTRRNNISGCTVVTFYCEQNYHVRTSLNINFSIKLSTKESSFLSVIHC